MSDNDDRMDRAERIRRMREGDRDEDQTDADTGTDPDQAGSPEDHDGTQGPGDSSEPDAATDPGGESAATVPTAGAGSGGSGDSGEDDGGFHASLPSTEQMEDALAGSAVDPDAAETVAPEGAEQTGQAAAPAGVAETETTTAKQETRVLEFELDGEYYCLDIEYIEEIVKQETITRVPNTADHVEGVVDLRGQITTILNPKVTIGRGKTGTSQLIVVFDPGAFEDQEHVGWVVDDVRQVAPITEAQVNDPPMDDEYVNGLIDRDGEEEFVIWITPDAGFTADD